MGVEKFRDLVAKRGLLHRALTRKGVCGEKKRRRLRKK